MAQVTLQGNPIHTNGDLPAVGSPAPGFKLPNGKLEDVTLGEFRGRKVLLNIALSLDTSTCAASARRFNEALASRDDVVALVITADLPFAQERFCSTEGLANVIPLSLMRGKQFAKDYGVFITDGPLRGLSARAIVVIDEQGTVTYTQLVPEVSAEPDYDAALAALG